MQESGLQPAENSNKDQQVPSKKRLKRTPWTDEEKRKILEECRQPGASVSSIARKYGVPSNQVFILRKKSEVAMPTIKLSASEQMEIEILSTLDFVQKCERLEQVLSGNLMEEIRVKKISPYNASIALSNLVTSREKLINLSLNLLERLQKLRPTIEESEPEVEEFDLRFRRQVEMLCMQMADEIYPPESEYGSSGK